jgi:hypothetical protein
LPPVDRVMRETSGSLNQELAGKGHAGEGVTGIELAERELVADVAPADLAVEGGGDRLVGEVAEFRSGDQRGGVDERDEAEPHGRVAAAGGPLSFAIRGDSQTPLVCQPARRLVSPSGIDGGTVPG